MRIINKKYLLIMFLIGIILTGVVILKPKENIKLDNVILKQEVNNKTFAMYKEESENNYIPVEGTEFPEMYVLNIKESKCIDNNGNELNGVLSYENDEVVLTTNKSSYCYLYFDKSIGLEINEKNPNGLKIDKVRGEMYRFQGQQSEGINNYICFGTSDEGKCMDDTNHYMYRIIGLEADTGRVKVIKMEALEKAYQWWDKDNEDIKFPDSNIYKSISQSDFLENDNYVPTGWENKISDNTWTYGDMWSNDELGAKQTGPELYKTETGKKATRWYNWAGKDTPGAKPYVVYYEDSPYVGDTIYYTDGSGKWTQTFTGKVSLMYLHDYYYSVSDGAICQIDEGEDAYSKCKLGWMHLSQSDKSALSINEWTMSSRGLDMSSGYFLGYYVNNVGYTHALDFSHYFSVRPVFYINASEELLSGEGTLDDPFIIN